MSMNRERQGSVILLVLCLVAVMGIILAGFLAVSNQSMKLANRAHLKDVSLKLAELGLERSLDAFANGTFSSWGVSGSTAKTSISISGSRYAATGITAEVNIRVDNFDFFQRDAVWNGATEYRKGELVKHTFFGTRWYYSKNDVSGGSGPSFDSTNWALVSTAHPPTCNWTSGVTYNPGDFVLRSSRWYRNIRKSVSNAPPNATYWSDAPLARYQWSAGSYRQNDIVYHRGVWYRCNTAHPNGTPPPDNYWDSAATTTWNVATMYSVNAYVSYGSVWYRCVTANSGRSPTNSTYWTAMAPVVYSEGVVTMANGNKIRTQLRIVVEPISPFSNAIAATGPVSFSAGGTVDSYDSAKGLYHPSSNVGDSSIIASKNTSSAAIILTSTQVKGYIAAPPTSSAPYAPWYSVSASAAVTQSNGSVSSPHPIAPNIDRGRTSKSPFIPKPTIITPQTDTAIDLPTLPDSLTLGDASDITWRTYRYSAGDLTLTSGYNYTINGPVRIIVTGNLTFSGNSSMVITSNATAKLELYVGGVLSMSSTGNDGIKNLTQRPRNLIIYISGSGSESSIENNYSTISPFYGAVYAANAGADLKIGGTNQPFYGAFSVGSLTVLNSPEIHHDTALRYLTYPGTQASYGFLDWLELTEPSEQITFP